MADLIDALTDREFRRLLASLSPSAMYLTGEDGLRVRSWNSAAGVTLAIEGRRLDHEGRIVPFGDRHVPATDRTEGTSLVQIGEGVLLNLSVRVTAGTPRRGACFVNVDVVRGFTGAIQPLAALVSDYATDGGRLAWPGGRIRHSSEGPGLIRSITGTNPAAGVEILETVPNNARWRLVSLFATLVTAVAVANREPELQITDGTNIVFGSTPADFQAASTTRRYCFYHGATPHVPAAAPAVEGGLPFCTIEDGFVIRTVTANLQAADDWSAPQLLVEEWLEE